MIKTIISDLGNVIVDFDNSLFFSRISRYCPYSLEEISRLNQENPNVHLGFDTGELSPREFYDKVSQILSANLSYDEFFQMYNEIFTLKQDVMKTYKDLRGKYRLLILSNTDPERFGFIKKTFPDILAFDDFVLSYECGFIKPQNEIYEIALRKAQAPPSECVFVDDIEENISAAASLGLNTIHFKPGTDLKSELKRFNIHIPNEG
jgi:epoxide hydrolase-like predicted phosphatase